MPGNLFAQIEGIAAEVEGQILGLVGVLDAVQVRIAGLELLARILNVLANGSGSSLCKTGS